jgi:hypothetical protein
MTSVEIAETIGYYIGVVLGWGLIFGVLYLAYRLIRFLWSKR